MDNSHLQSLASSIRAITSPFYDYLCDVHQQYQALQEGTIAADWMTSGQSEIESTPANWFGISVVTIDGQILEVGDCNQTFTLRSLSRALVYGLALEDWGRQTVSQTVGIEPEYEVDNAVVLGGHNGRPHNPMISTGAIAVANLIKGDNSVERLKRVLEMFRRYMGREVQVDMTALMTEQERGDRERAIAHLMRKFGLIQARIDEVLELYFQSSSILVTSHDLAVIAVTLANGGINPLTGERALQEQYVQDVISMILTCGMGQRSGEWTYRIGIPAQAASSGSIMAIVPQKLGMGIFSPPIDAYGNSVRGMKVCEEISREHGLHLFNIYAKNQQMLKYIEQVEKVTAAAAALENDTYTAHSLSDVVERSDELGQLARVFQRMVTQVRVREQKLKQQLQELHVEIDRAAQAQQVAEILDTQAFRSVKEKLDRMRQLKQQRNQ